MEDKIINFRVRKEEHEIIKNNARKTNLTVSQYARKLCLNEIPESIEKQKISIELINFWQEIDENKYYSIIEIKSKLELIILGN